MNHHVYFLTIEGEPTDHVVICHRNRNSDQQFSDAVPRRSAMYFLPDGTIADVTQTLVWCFSCKNFSDGELIRSIEEFEEMVESCSTERLPRPYSYICDSDSMVKRFSEHVSRCINAIRFRDSPPRCLRCGTVKIEQILSEPKETFTDPLGRSVYWTDRIVGTDVDDLLFVYDHNGRSIGKMPLICPETNTLIFDEFPPEHFARLLAASQGAR